MDTNYNQMKSDLEEMEKKYNDVLDELDGLIYQLYTFSLQERREMEHFESVGELAHHLSHVGKRISERVGLYPYNQKVVKHPSNDQPYPYSTFMNEKEVQ